MKLHTNTKEVIFDQALSLFARLGYNGTSIRDICSAVGIKESSYYNHYAGKKDVLDAILKACDEYFIKSIPSLEERKTLAEKFGFREMLHAIINRFIEMWTPYALSLWYVVHNEQYINPEADRIVLAECQRRLSLVTATFDMAQEIGKMSACNSHDVAILYVHSIRSQHHNYTISRLYESADKMVAETMHLTSDMIADFYEMK